MDERLHRYLKFTAIALTLAFVGHGVYGYFLGSRNPGDYAHTAGSKYFADGNYADALEAYAEALAADPAHYPAMVGRARTARIAGLAPPTEDDATIKARRLDYFRAMARGPMPTVAVIEDLDYPNCIAGWWGEVHVAVHKGLGMKGAVKLSLIGNGSIQCRSQTPETLHRI